EAEETKPRGLEEAFFTHRSKDNSVLVVLPFSNPPFHGRFRFPLSEDQLDELYGVLPADGYNLSVKNEFDGHILRTFSIPWN
ncbi:hypothetical protein PFISCL1PPCAC_6486, partial [Pristionchus fissidentatus]